MLFVTKPGVGISPDSVTYISAARNLISGRGLSVSFGNVAPLTHFPPLFPSIIALPGIIGLGPISVARWLNAILFGANILLIGLIIYSYAKKSTWIPILGSLLLLTSVDMLDIHSWVWSEPMFIFLCCLSLYLLDSYIKNLKYTFLAASAVFAALALLDRYTGMALIFAGIAGIILLTDQARNKKLIAFFVFAFISISPLAAWTLRNLLIAGNATNRTLAFHPVTLLNLNMGFLTFLAWLLPDNMPVISMVVIGAIILFFTIYRRRIKATGESVRVENISNVPSLFTYFILIYLAFLIIAISFFDASTPLDDRLLSPIFVSLVVVMLYGTKVIFSSKERFFKQVVAVSLLILAGSYFARSGIWMNQNYSSAHGYADSMWKTSQIVKKIEKMPASIYIYSNLPDAVYISTGRTAYWIPEKSDPTSHIANPRYSAEMDVMKKRLRKNGVLVYFTRRRRKFLPSDREILKLAIPSVRIGHNLVYGAGFIQSQTKSSN